ncbi:MAG: homogentisate 1,2-dioxygenase [Hyphomicrobiales bacterium]
MPFYKKMGNVPQKRHTVFNKDDGSLYSEQLIASDQPLTPASLTYHLYPPTIVSDLNKPIPIAPVIAEDKNLQHRSFVGFNVKPIDDYLDSRKIILVNEDLYISLAAPRKSMTDYFYKNSMADELIFVHHGSGVLKTMFGDIKFKSGDHLIIPKSTTYQIHFNDSNNRLYIVESFSTIKVPDKYLTQLGQINEHSPYCERDIRTPELQKPIDKEGNFLIKIKKHDQLYPFFYAYHPFDVVGWDGYHYPFAFSVHEFEPITGSIHQPSPIHQTFEGKNFFTCAFVPRLFDYHPDSIPAPYNHMNIDSDEVIYYVDGNFMSRKNIKEGHITLHPFGIPHGPHPGLVEKSIGKEDTQELAILVNTYNPVSLTEEALNIEVKDYLYTWIDQ